MQDQPMTDALLAQAARGEGETKEPVEPPFIAAIQQLPPRQRTALVLCDVLRFLDRSVIRGFGLPDSLPNEDAEGNRDGAL